MGASPVDWDVAAGAIVENAVGGVAEIVGLVLAVVDEVIA